MNARVQQDGGEPEALLAAAQRRLDASSKALSPVRIAPAPEASSPVAVAPAAEPTPVKRRRRKVADPAQQAAEADGGDPAGVLAAAKAAGQGVARGDEPIGPQGEAKDSGRLRRKLVARRGAPMSTDTLGGDGPFNSAPAEKPAGWRRLLPKMPAAPELAVPAKIWLGVAGITFLIVLVLTVSGGEAQPAPLPVSALRVVWRPGPRLPADEVATWLRRSPVSDQLGNPNAWVLDQLADWLRKQPAVAKLVQVRLVHEADVSNGKSPANLQRVLEVELALRTPVMPAVLASGERAWIDTDGHVLPGELPAPRVARPMMRQMESAGTDTVQAAIAMWMRLEADIPPGLVSDILCDDELDDNTRGIVLVTHQGARLVWGNPREERFGITAEDRASALIHALRCQGDLAHVASINVRFRQPVLVLKD